MIPNVWLWLSVFFSILIAITSLSGIFLERTYLRETKAWALQAIGQDYGNLAVVKQLGKLITEEFNNQPAPPARLFLHPAGIYVLEARKYV